MWPNLSLWNSCIKGSNSRVYSGVTDLEVPGVLSYMSNNFLCDLTIDAHLLGSLNETIWCFPNIANQIEVILLVGSVVTMSSLRLESIWQRRYLSNLISSLEVNSCQIQPRPSCTYLSLSGKLEQNRVRSPCYLWLPYLNTISKYRWNWVIIWQRKLPLLSL